VFTDRNGYPALGALAGQDGRWVRVENAGEFNLGVNAEGDDGNDAVVPGHRA